MEFGAHLPLIDLGRTQWSLTALRDYAGAAADLGYRYLCANDHLVFARPWLDGPTALAATLEVSRDIRLATTVALPVVRGPAQTAKVLGAIDLLSGGRLTVGVGPGSSPRDYELAGCAFEDRWRRLDEAIAVLRAWWTGGAFSGAFYHTGELALEPRPLQQPPPIWIGSWGSAAGLRRVARLGDGWLASAYNTTPAQFRQAWDDIGSHLRRHRKLRDDFPNAVATMWTYITDQAAEAERMLDQVLAPMLKRPVEQLRDGLPIGAPAHCAQLLSAYAAAGAQCVFIWPLADEVRQLARFRERVVPLMEPAA